MHIHYFQHDHFEDLGYIGNWASDKGFTTSVTRFDLNPELPLFDDFDWLVVLGGKMSVHDTHLFPWLKKEIVFIQEAIKRGKTVLGICLGSQLVAISLGADVYKNAEPEMGFWPVHFTSDASSDVVFRHFPSSLKVLHVHFDTFNLPEGAVNISGSAITENQAFRLGNRVFGFQFHFEVSPENLTRFIHEIEPELVEGRYSQTTSQMLEYADQCRENNQIFGKVLDEILFV